MTDDGQARLARLLQLIDEAKVWRDRPLAEAFAAFTAGLTEAEKGTVGYLALNFVVTWGEMAHDEQRDMFAADELAQLPALDDAPTWAAYHLGIVAADKITDDTNPAPATGLRPAA